MDGYDDYDEWLAYCRRVQAQALAGDPLGRLIEEWPTLDRPTPDDTGVQDGTTLKTLTPAEHKAKVAANHAARTKT